MVITYPYLSFSIFLLCEYCCYGAIGSFFCLLVFFRMHIVCVGVVKFSLPSFPRFFFRMHMVAVGGERLPRRMDWIVGRATEGSGGRHSSTPRGSLSPSYPNRMLRRMQGRAESPCSHPQVRYPALSIPAGMAPCIRRVRKLAPTVALSKSGGRTSFFLQPCAFTRKLNGLSFR